ncbi:AP-4 complex accessory subunit Tepsin [Podila epigama]|nr:AP-4 complex accessory subunit Tepsin [Podila epigama]
MNQLAETTKATIGFIQTHALLAKALSNDSKPTPGYLFPEITQLTRTPGTSAVVLSHLLKTISPSSTSTLAGSSSLTYSSSAHVLLKAVKILRQLAQSGSIEFRRALARQGKKPLGDLVNYHGPWDEIHGDQFNQDIRTVAEDLLEYMYANPVQDPEEYHGVESEGWTDHEEAVLNSSTQGLQGFGNPEYDNSSDDDDDRGVNRHDSGEQRSLPTRGRNKRSAQVTESKDQRPTPPLPGFGNPAFPDASSQEEPSLLTKLFDRLQDLAAPPPPLAMRAAYREQESRRQKMFVGDYSMSDDGSETRHGHRGKADMLASRVKVGTNPFMRTNRIQGMAAGGWADTSITSNNGGIGDYSRNRVMLQQDLRSNRAFPIQQSPTQNYPGRSKLSAAIYPLATATRGNYIRHLRQQDFANKASKVPVGAGSHGSLQGSLVSGIYTNLRWSNMQAICDIFSKSIQQEEENATLGSVSGDKEQHGQAVAELLRDLNDWIESEDWERRLVSRIACKQ